ncbi:response regulator transcription factor [Streptomonospora wellingtoniae]|uniref:Response regulator transcription factor n=1 Tax=Streptomonospora wellingtoniae TaxID=3075544 RepID=A0ABU2KRI8_9ACTN|nr:response regulator transcription factor [Streptomonospora sp. DSM 45055]MDT0301896.1 response regulator transcription factor [Streptomonospora sp. DSM 45055]
MRSPNPITLTVADHYSLGRAAWRGILAPDYGFEVVAEVSCPAGINRIARGAQQDILLTDLCFQGVHPFDEISRASTHTRVVVITRHEETEVVREAMRCGVRAYLPKTSSVDELFTALRTVADDDLYLHHSIGCKLASGPADCTTAREREVIRLLASGHTIDTAASMLHVSPRTIEGDRAALRDKLGLQTRAELFAYARDRGILLLSCPDLPTPS